MVYCIYDDEHEGIYDDMQYEGLHQEPVESPFNNPVYRAIRKFTDNESFVIWITGWLQVKHYDTLDELSLDDIEQEISQVKAQMTAFEIIGRPIMADLYRRYIIVLCKMRFYRAYGIIPDD